jgi:hypothetical protein
MRSPPTPHAAEVAALEALREALAEEATVTTDSPAPTTIADARRALS